MVRVRQGNGGGMRIRTNVAALGVHRALLHGASPTGRPEERLSSGFRINHAADDAAGLAVSETLLSRAGGMRLAARNAGDGIGLVRTAEGALAGTTSVLQRMRDLSVRAGSDALDTAARRAMQSEIDQLSRELDRIATTTAHNGTRLLDGSYRGAFQVGAGADHTLAFAIGADGAVDAAGLGVAGIDVTRPPGAAGTTAASTAATAVVTPAVPGTGNARRAGSITLAGDFVSPGRYQASYTGLTGTISYDGRTLDLAAIDYTGDTSAADYRQTFGSAVTAAFGLAASSVTASSTELVITGDRPRNGSTAAEAQQLTPGYTPAPVTTPGDPPSPPTPPGNPPAPPTTPTTPPPTPPVTVADPVRAIDEALRRVGAMRTDLGALENRLEHTVSWLGVATDNSMAAYSRIRDADIAQEMTRFTRNQVLLQAGTAMLAQANQAPRNALQLLV